MVPTYTDSWVAEARDLFFFWGQSSLFSLGWLQTPLLPQSPKCTPPQQACLFIFYLFFVFKDQSKCVALVGLEQAM